jgi:hypothetical protein
MSQFQEVASREEALCIQLQDARIAVDLTLRELEKAIDERDAIKAELAFLMAERATSDASRDEFVVPWGYCEDDD